MEPTIERAFFVTEVESLQAFDFVAMCPAQKPLKSVEIACTEDKGLEVRVPGRPSFLPPVPVNVRSALRDLDFESEDPADPGKPWVRHADDAASAIDLAQRVLAEVFHADRDVRLDLTHGSHKAEHEAHQRLDAVRDRIGKLLFEMLEHRPERDEDGDYMLGIEDVHVSVAPRIMTGGEVIVRVFSVTNVGITVGPELALMLARLNFLLMFGRFVLDAEHQSIWVDESLLGSHFSDEEFRFTVKAVASIADEWDDRLKQMFGGATYQDVLEKRTGHEVPPIKPGQGGYI